MAVLEHPLTDRIVDAAEHAIRAHERSIERHPGSVRSVVIELTLKSDRHKGALVSECDVYLHRRVPVLQGAGRTPADGGLR